jgi:hypothetical protein
MSDEELILKLIDRAQSQTPRRQRYKKNRTRWQVALYDPSSRTRDVTDFNVTLSPNPDDFLNPADDSIV